MCTQQHPLVAGGLFVCVAPVWPVVVLWHAGFVDRGGTAPQLSQDGCRSGSLLQMGPSPCESQNGCFNILMILFHQVDPDFEEECLEFQPSVSMGKSLLVSMR